MNQQRREFAAFLRARRAELAPQDVGLHTADHPRRVPGLRREEVAGRAGISSDYYTRLEQGRLPAPSPSVLNALARALLLNDDQRDYLRQLAGRAPARRRHPRRQIVPAPLHAILSRRCTAKDSITLSTTLALPRARAGSCPSRVRSRMSSRLIPDSAASTVNTNPGRVVAALEFSGEELQAHVGGLKLLGRARAARARALRG
ncbi:helix-turn-helix domain-containing protein [Nonomuraea sp. NPDC050394]|uniref:helix-turn-helix domain-containing protein n=1 Tax=Nonomuraea sp. NPDC050394 TaxID=3364363 RepID=UPI0037BDCE76